MNTPPIQNCIGPSNPAWHCTEPQRAALKATFGWVEVLRPPLIEPLMAFLTEPGAAQTFVLDPPWTADEYIQRNGMPPWRLPWSNADRRDLLNTLQGAPPEFFRRLGQVFSAVFASEYAFNTSPFPPQPLGWLTAVMTEFGGRNRRNDPWGAEWVRLTASDLVSLLTLERRTEITLVAIVLNPELPDYGKPQFEEFFVKTPGLSTLVTQHPGEVRRALTAPKADSRAYALGRVKALGLEWEPFVKELTELSLDSSKEVRQVAQSIVRELKLDVRSGLEAAVLKGSKDRRLLALQLLAEFAPESTRPFLETHVAAEKNEAVRRAMESILAEPGATSVAPAVNTPDLPPMRPVLPETPLAPEVRSAWKESIQKACKDLHGSRGPAGKEVVPSAATLESVVQWIEDGKGKPPALTELAYRSWDPKVRTVFVNLVRQQPLEIVHLVRFASLTRGTAESGPSPQELLGRYGWLFLLLPEFNRRNPAVGLREIEAAVLLLGFTPLQVSIELFRSSSELAGLGPEQIWPYWSLNLDRLKDAFSTPSVTGTAGQGSSSLAKTAISLLATFPQLPEAFTPHVFAVALGPKSQRAEAQQWLERLPHLVESLILKLPCIEAEERRAAIEWLGRLGDIRAVAPLRAELTRARDAATKAVVMGALERLGVPPSEFLDRAGLEKEAAKAAAKPLPGDLAWFPFASLPAVHWETDGKPVSPEILRAWLVESFKLKDPAPGTLLRTYAAALRPAERHALGRLVLQAWIAADIEPRPAEECAKEARDAAAQQFAFWKQYPQFAQGPQKSEAELEAEYLAIFSQRPKGSAISSKGILALAGACASGSDAVPLVSAYIKQWYGNRAGQCRALIQMLAWMNHPLAIQYLLSIGKRFRTRSIQEEAHAQTQLIAERNQWSVDQLADRTIPSAGFDDAGALTLDFGPRQFIASLTDDLDIVLKDPEGKAIKALPEPRKDDDPALVSAAKSAFSAARKELKTIVSLQRERLYEAMCIARAWPFEEWQLYLLRHPVVRHLCKQLVWRIDVDGASPVLVRPLADGSLTTVEDEPFTPEPVARIQVAHETLVTPAESEAWRQHFADYAVEPLFLQFGRPPLPLTEEALAETDIRLFEGHLVEAFRLRTRATKLGYVRGPTEDGGWFYSYRKRFPSLALEAVLEFSGNELPETNRTTALRSLSFLPITAQSAPDMSAAPVTLGTVPKVLLSECGNDLKLMAADGPGYDPQWESKVQA